MSIVDRRGFTLLETVVALAIVTLTGVAALATLGTELRTAERAHRTLEVAALARDVLSRVHLLDDEGLHRLPDSLVAGQFAAPFQAYRWHTTTQPVRDDPGLFDVSVSVSWQEGTQQISTRLYRTPDGSRP